MKLNGGTRTGSVQWRRTAEGRAFRPPGRCVRRRLAALALLAAAVLAGAPADAAPRLLVDARTGSALYAEDASAPWHPASLTKLMTAHIALSAARAGRIAMDSMVVMSSSALKEPPSKLGLPLGETLTLEDALRVMLVRSANDVAVAIAETIAVTERDFVALMNTEAARLGMTGTHFVNANGLHDPRQVTTARDMAVLALAIMKNHPRHLGLFATRSITVSGRTMRNTNDLLGEYPGMTGMKTGYVCASGFNLVTTAQRGGRTLIAVVMGAPSTGARGEAMRRLLDAGFSGAHHPTTKLARLAAPRPGQAPDLRKYSCGKALPS